MASSKPIFKFGGSLGTPYAPPFGTSSTPKDEFVFAVPAPRPPKTHGPFIWTDMSELAINHGPVPTFRLSERKSGGHAPYQKRSPLHRADAIAGRMKCKTFLELMKESKAQQKAKKILELESQTRRAFMKKCPPMIWYKSRTTTNEYKIGEFCPEQCEFIRAPSVGFTGVLVVKQTKDILWDGNHHEYHHELPSGTPIEKILSIKTCWKA